MDKRKKKIAVMVPWILRVLREGCRTFCAAKFDGLPLVLTHQDMFSSLEWLPILRENEVSEYVL